MCFMLWTLNLNPLYMEVNDWDQPLVKRRKLSEHADSSCPRNADPQGERGDGGPGDNEAYFSANFKSVCSSVLSEGSPERHVLTDDEAGIIRSFMNLPHIQQQLYVRLFLRKHQWLRVAKLRYDYIAEDLTPVITGLVADGFLCTEDELTNRREALNLLQLSELKLLCRDLKMPTSLQRCQKSEIISAFFTHAQQHKPLFGTSSLLDVVFKRVKRLLGDCVRVSSEPVEIFSKCLLLYSLTTSLLLSSWTDEEERNFSDVVYRLLQVKTGHLVFYEYEVYVTESLFKTAEDFSRFYRVTRDLHSLLMEIENKEDKLVLSFIKKAKHDFEQEIKNGCTAAGFMQRMTTGWVLAKTLSCGVEYLEKKGDYRQANDLLKLLLSQTHYGSSHRGHWFERLALNLDYHLGERSQCLDVIRSAMEESTLHPAKHLSLLQRAHKLYHTTSNSKNKRAMRREGSVLQSSISDFPQLDIIPAPEVTIEAQQHHIDNRPLYAIPSQECPGTYNFVGVEGLAMYHYNTVESWPCAVHAERSTFSLMFALLMWDVIFCPGIPNVFRTKLQAGPLDLLTDDFYSKRTEMIETRLKWIKSAANKELATAVERCWEENKGLVCYGADWDLLPSIKDAKALAICMGGELLSQVCRQFAKSYGQSCSGLPDLTLWNPTNTTCKFVEVKGPGDRLSYKQIVWLSRLSTWGCQVEVCHVKVQPR